MHTVARGFPPPGNMFAQRTARLVTNPHRFRNLGTRNRSYAQAIPDRPYMCICRWLGSSGGLLSMATHISCHVCLLRYFPPSSHQSAIDAMIDLVEISVDCFGTQNIRRDRSNEGRIRATFEWFNSLGRLTSQTREPGLYDLRSQRDILATCGLHIT